MPRKVTDSEAIDRVIRSYPWMDFEVTQCSRWKMSVDGATDPSGTPEITITFSDIAFVALPLEWKTDTAQRVFGIVRGDTEFELNTLYAVEQGYTIFEFQPEDLKGTCRIGARTVELTEHRLLQPD